MKARREIMSLYHIGRIQHEDTLIASLDKRKVFMVDGIIYLGEIESTNSNSAMRMWGEKHCNHNAMTARMGDPRHAWECATCGYIYGS